MKMTVKLRDHVLDIVSKAWREQKDSLEEALKDRPEEFLLQMVVVNAVTSAIQMKLKGELSAMCYTPNNKNHDT